ncbi:hypothetical protein BPT24_196 [Tenacibaculum phage pT24]|uniref:Uncharacterized protein n=1 Tax=Tenacibaculum phage pT24 TaxID=1880590 RepID=A0A1B4XWY2_9CAUD|nr:hypothetical protein HYP10_gp196 [Tenacibaculum phage pT24]BAV39320.1 hypothetical protein BPT24_196 [Tenacibaculum phage pT24]
MKDISVYINEKLGNSINEGKKDTKIEYIVKMIKHEFGSKHNLNVLDFNDKEITFDISNFNDDNKVLKWATGILNRMYGDKRRPKMMDAITKDGKLIINVKDASVNESEEIDDEGKIVEAEQIDPKTLYKKANNDLMVILRELGLGATPRIDELWSGVQGLQVECKISSHVEYPMITMENMKVISKLKTVRYISFRDFQHGYFQVYFKHEN